MLITLPPSGRCREASPCEPRCYCRIRPYSDLVSPACATGDADTISDAHHKLCTENPMRPRSIWESSSTHAGHPPTQNQTARPKSCGRGNSSVVREHLSRTGRSLYRTKKTKYLGFKCGCGITDIRSSPNKIFLPSGKHRVAPCYSMFSFAPFLAAASRELSCKINRGYQPIGFTPHRARPSGRGISCISCRCRTGRDRCGRPWAAPDGSA
jgi:hypothetical protein